MFGTALLALILPAVAGTVAASSELKGEDGVRHTAALAFDGALATSWMEAEEGAGAGSWIELTLDRVTPIVSVSVWPGDLGNGRRSLREFGRPRTVTVELTGGASTVTQQAVFEDGAVVGPKRFDIPVRGDARKVRIRIDESYDGIVYAGTTAIAEVALNFAEGEPHPWVGKMFAWVDGDVGKREKGDNDAEVGKLADKVRAGGAEGDPDALAELMDRAGDGAPYLRRQVARYVPLGYRVQATTPDDTALAAIIDLKDPTAIPAVERASLRVTGHAEKRLQGEVEKFYAYADLIGGRSPNVPNWGQTGWAPGELQALGEPLAIAADSLGRLWVADTGNHRIQRFSASGNAEASVGSGKADITNTWIGGTRKWYVAGNAPGTDKGSFQTPIDVRAVAGKTGDKILVLDAGARVQVIDASGRVDAAWSLPVSNTPLIAGVGGQGYVLYSKGRVVAIWGDHAYAFDMTGAAITDWEVTDGAPSGAETLPNGKLVLIFGDELVMYSSDGFRHGSLLGDTLGAGFEAWDVAIDNEGRLWAVTDTGRAIKYKKPGKPEFSLQISRDPILLPRIDVFDGVIYLTTKDSIRRVDALEMWAKEQAGG